MTKEFSLLFYLLVMVNSNLWQNDTTNREKHQLMPPVLEYEPDNEVYTYYVDSTIFLPCLAKGQERSQEKTPWVSWWTKNGENITSKNVLIGQYSKTDHKYGLKIPSAQRYDAGRYQCFVSNGVGVTMSNFVEVRYIEIPQKSTEKRRVGAIEGQPFILSCELPQKLVNDENSYWIRKSKYSIKNQPQEIYKEPQIIPLPDGSLWFSSILRRDDSENNAESLGNYYYFVFGRQKGICETVLKVQTSSNEVAPSDPIRRFVSQRNIITEKGARVKLFCVYGGNPFPIITWEKDGVKLESKDNIHIVESRSIVIINVFRQKDVGTYTCKVHKNHTIYEKNEFTVNIGKPYFIETPQEKNTTLNGSAEFYCIAADGDFSFRLSYTWIFNGKPIAEWPFNVDYKIDYQYGKYTLRIDVVKDIHIGNYGCNASNIHGYVYKEAYLFIKPAERVRITDESKSTQTAVVNLHEPFQWACPVDGVPSPTVTFTKGYEEIINNGHYSISDGGKVLEIRDFSYLDSGKFVCKAINEITTEPVRAEIYVVFDSYEDSTLSLQEEIHRTINNH